MVRIDSTATERAKPPKHVLERSQEKASHAGLQRQRDLDASLLLLIVALLQLYLARASDAERHPSRWRTMRTERVKGDSELFRGSCSLR